MGNLGTLDTFQNVPAIDHFRYLEYSFSRQLDSVLFFVLQAIGLTFGIRFDLKCYFLVTICLSKQTVLVLTFWLKTFVIWVT